MSRKKRPVLAGALILALGAYGILGIAQAREAILPAREEQQRLVAAIEAAREENARLEDELSRAGDPELMADMIRLRLGLVRPGETVFYDTGRR